MIALDGTLGIVEEALRDGKFIVGVDAYKAKKPKLFKVCQREKEFRAAHGMPTDCWIANYIERTMTVPKMESGETEDSLRY